MDWTTMSSLYGSVDDYQTQLRKLEQYCRSNPNDPASAFVLAYQYLALGEKNDAINALRVVVKNQPKDSTAKRMLDALSPQQKPQAHARLKPSAAPRHRRPIWSANGGPRRATRRSTWRSAKTRNSPGRRHRRESRLSS